MNTRSLSGRAVQLTLLFLAAVALVGCGGGGEDHAIAGFPDPPAPLPTTGTGKLTVKATTTDGEILPGATVVLAIGPDTRIEKATAADGSVVFDTLPERVTVFVSHALGGSTYTVAIAQTGMTVLDAAVKPRMPRPTVALLPVEIVAGSVSADRRELAFEVRLVSSAAAPFIEFETNGDPVTPYLALNFDDSDGYSDRACIVATSRLYPIPACASLGTSPYAVTVDAYHYAPEGVPSTPSAAGESSSTLLLLDEGQRIAAGDPSNYRSFAARRLVRRLLDDSPSASALSIAGFAGRGNAITEPQLPSLPLWLPRGSGADFTRDVSILSSDIAILESMAGGNSPVFEALQSASSLMASRPGTRTVVALLGGGDDGEWTEEEQDSRLAALQHLQEDTAVRSILVSAPSKSSWRDATGRQVTDSDTFPKRKAVAELAAALHAPIVATDSIFYDVPSPIRADATYAAFDLVADLIEGAPLPSLSATFRVRAPSPGAFPSGSMLRGVLYVQDQSCPFECAEVAIAFAARIP
jgi:hypothetical protein